MRKPYSRHLGGVNIGFLDGHAAWFKAEFILNQSARYACGCWGSFVVADTRELRGLVPEGVTTVGRAGANPSYPKEGDCPSLGDCDIPCLF